MIIKKHDFTILREAEEKGLSVALTSLVQPKRTEKNEALSNYFRKNWPNFNGLWDEDDGEEVLEIINEHLKDKGLKKLLEFPYSSGDDVHLVPVGENILLKVIVADEYLGSGDYSKYVMSNFFIMNEKTSINDVDLLIEFLKTLKA